MQGYCINHLLCNTIGSETSQRNFINQRTKKPIWILKKNSCIIKKF